MAGTAEAAEQALLPGLALLRGAARLAQQEGGRGKALGAVRVEPVERASLDEALELPPVEAARVETLREIEQILERAIAAAPANQLFHRLRTDPFDRGQRVADCRLAGLAVGFHREGDVRAIDVGRQQPDVEAVQFLPEMRE